MAIKKFFILLEQKDKKNKKMGYGLNKSKSGTINNKEDNEENVKE